MSLRWFLFVNPGLTEKNEILANTHGFFGQVRDLDHDVWYQRLVLSSHLFDCHKLICIVFSGGGTFIKVGAQVHVKTTDNFVVWIT